MVDRICDNCMSRVPADAEKCPKCGIRFENTNPGGALPNGWVLGDRYTIGRYLDIDGEGVTYSAIDSNTLQRVIVKEFMPVTLCATRDEMGAIVSKPGCEVLFKTTKMDYTELYSTLLRIGFVEGLVQVLDVLEANNTSYAVLEKIEGPTLSEYLVKQEDPIDPNRALGLLRPVLLGVEALHSANVVHRGISPDNIVLESGGTAKLGGFATLALRQQGSELKSKLYPGYSAPEQYTAAEFEGRYTDVYALGAVLYDMVTGEVPISADERKMQDNLPPARTLDKEIPTFLSTAIARAMRIAPQERIQNIGDLRLALSGEGGRVAPPVKTKPKQGEAKGPLGLTKKQMIIGGSILGGIVLIILIVLLISLFRGGDDDSSTLPVSSSSAVINELRVPNFEGQRYASVIGNSSYTDVYNFGDPVEEHSTEVEEGYIITQDPPAGSEWNGQGAIILTVSLGAEEVEMPSFAPGEVTAEEAQRQLSELDIESTVVQEVNDGSYTEGTVIRTSPEAGQMIKPGEDTVTLYVAGAASSISMPDVTGDTEDTARAVLTGSGIREENISTTEAANNEGRQMNGRVSSTSPGPGESVSPGSTRVTLYLYENYKMPNLDNLVGMSLSDAEAYCNDRAIPYTIRRTNNGNGVVASAEGYDRNADVTDSNVVTLVEGAAPAPTPTPSAG